MIRILPSSEDDASGLGDSSLSVAAGDVGGIEVIGYVYIMLGS